MHLAIITCLFLTVLLAYIVFGCDDLVFIITLIWSIQVILSLIVFDSFLWQYSGLVWLIVAIWSLNIGYALCRNPKIDTAKEPVRFAYARFKTIYIISFTLAMGCVLYWIFSFNIPLATFLDIYMLAELNNNIASERYFYGGISNNWVMQLLIPFTYVTPMLAGYACPYLTTNREKTAYALAAFIPVLGSLFIINTKASIVSSVVFFVVAFWVSWLYKYKKPYKLRSRQILTISMILGGIVLILMSSMFLRIGRVEAETWAIVFDKFGIYALGHVPAFDSWFASDSLDYLRLSIGEETFAGLYNAIGVRERIQGVYSDYVLISGMSGSNVYSFFRGLISDFGIIGSWIFIMLTGAMLGGMLNNIQRHIVNAKSLAIVLAVVLGSFWLFFAVSVLAYSSYWVSFFILYISIKLVHH